MKFLLIRPPFVVEKKYFPRFSNESLGTETLEAFLIKKCNVKVVDCVAEKWNKIWEIKNLPELYFQGLKPEQIFKKIKSFKPDIVGINWLFTAQSESVNLIINLIRKFSKNMPIVVGGAHPSADPKKTLLENDKIDIVVCGEGEITMQELIDNKLENLENILGIAYRKNNEIVVNPSRELIKDLDTIPLPKRSRKKHKNYSKQHFFKALFEKMKKIKLPEIFIIKIVAFLSNLPVVDKIYYKIYNKNRNISLPAADIITSRGCPNHCTFCAVHNIWGHRWRARSAENVLKEIDDLVNNFGVKHLNIVDDNFNISKERTIEICKGIIERDYKITLFASSGSYVPTLDEEVLTWLKKAGLNHIRMSIESGSQEMLDNVIKKHINLNQVKSIVGVCKKLNIYTEAAFIFGIPGETIETMKQTLKFSEEIGFNRVIKFIFQPFENTELYDVCVENNYLTEDYDPQQTYVTGDKCFVKTDEFSPEDVLKIVNR